MSSEIGDNSSVRVNGGDLVFSNRTEFSAAQNMDMQVYPLILLRFPWAHQSLSR